MKSKAMQRKSMQCNAKQGKAKQCKAMQCKAMESNAKQSNAKQSKTKQLKAMQSKIPETVTYDTFSLALPKCFGNTCKNVFTMPFEKKKYLIRVAPGSFVPRQRKCSNIASPANSTTIS